MSKVLVKWEDNWADEMDVEGFAIMEESEWKELKDTAKKVTKPLSINVGTNEEIEYSDGSDFLSSLTAKKITSDEEKAIVKFFGSSGGHDYFQYVLDDCIEDDNTDDEVFYEEEEDEEDF